MEVRAGRCGDETGIKLMRLAGSVALVTGGSAGIGEQVARRLARAGASVLVHGRDEERTHEVAHQIGGTALVADLLQSSAESLVDQALNVHGHVDVLVANAGSGHSGPFNQMTAERVDQILDLNLVVPTQLSRLLVPHMIEQGQGRLVYVSSVAGRTAVAGEAVYSAAKAGLDTFADSLRLELTGSGVGVSVAVPAVVDTGFFAERGRPYDRRFPRPVSADRVAEAIVSALQRDRDEVWIPRWPRIAPVVRAVLPSAYRRLSARFGEPVRGREQGSA